MSSSRRRVAVATAFLALLLSAALAGGPLAGTAQAAPRTAQATSGAAPGYQLMKARLASGKRVVARWNPCQRQISYRINVSRLAKAKREAMRRQIVQGFARLAAADGMTYRYAGTTTFVPMRNNARSAPAEIVVAAVERTATDLAMTENSLGFGGVMWSTWSGPQGEGAAVVRGYVILSPSGMARVAAGFGRGMTQGNVILHELGHATGLNHTAARNQLMYPTLTTSAPNGYAAGDRAGLKRLGAPAGCIAIPGFVTVPDLD